MENIEVIVQSARRLQLEIDKMGVGQPSSPEVATLSSEDFVGLYDILIKSKEIRDASRKLFLDGHYARAVEEAYKCINNVVKAKSNVSKDGQDLMNHVFSEKNPILKINKLKTVSHRNEQIGYMLIFGGCMTGIRNPRAHEHKKTDTPEDAFEMLVWANHLMKNVRKAKRVRKPKSISAS